LESAQKPGVAIEYGARQSRKNDPEKLVIDDGLRNPSSNNQDPIYGLKHL